MKKQRMKRLLSVLLAAIMIMAMAVTGFADTGTSAETKGTITITNAKQGQTYTLYKLLELESYNTDSGAYTYKAVAAWKGFLETKGFAFDAQGYITTNPLTADKDIAAFAKDALQYAKNNTIASVASKPADGDTLEFTNLDLGYYLVDSSLGALCSLDTTDNDVEIKEKNSGAPDVDKKIVETDGPVADNSVAIGDNISYAVTITAKDGAENYALHDTMTAGLAFNNDVTVTKKSGAADPVTVAASNYEVVTAPTDTCTFEVKFTEAFCEGLKDGDVITITYSAKVTTDAIVGTDYKNDALLSYGDTNTTVSTETVSKTYGINVFKFANKTVKKDGKEVEEKVGLANAVFKLKKISKNEAGENVEEVIELVKVPKKGDNVYRKAISTDDKKDIITEITTPADGRFTVYGLETGKYSLEEKTAPAGYNKLAADKEFTIDKVDANVPSGNVEVEVENKTGALLPSTGGIGTTIFYAAGIVVMAGAVFFVVRSRKHD